jgi:8-oxo-dGTP diphosphatase
METIKQPIHVVGAILLKGDRILIARRAQHKSSAGLWEFPGGKVETGETPVDALQRELVEELGVVAEPLYSYHVSESQVGATRILLEVFVCRLLGEFSGHSIDHDSFLWAAASELAGLEWPAPDLPAVAKLSKLQSLGELLD